ncbi:MAG: PAS domain-containing protein [Calditrichaeota bacterium]|nr:MAG: PAS domain-containing protein [Calditrichota bacterium]
MKTQFNAWFWFGIITVLLFLIFGGGAFLVWTNLQPQEKAYLLEFLSHHPAFLITPFILLFFAFALVFKWLMDNYFLPLEKILEALKIIRTVNPSHRIKVFTSGKLNRLAEDINLMASRYEELTGRVDEMIDSAKKEVEEEKNTLAALMSELPDGVIVCNMEGSVLLYNQQARRLVGNSTQSLNQQQASLAHPWLGIGRSIFNIFTKSMILHAMNDLLDRLQRDSTTVTSQFVTMVNGRLLRVQMVPVLDKGREMNGFILVLHNITREIETYRQRDYLLQVLMENVRASLASIRAAIEMIVDYPQMDTQKRDQFYDIIKMEAQRLSSELDQTVSDFSVHFKAQWPLENILSSDFLFLMQRRISEQCQVSISVEETDQELWINVDSYSFVQSCCFMINAIKEKLEVTEFRLSTGKEKRFVYIDIRWEGPPFPREMLASWYGKSLLIHGEGIPFTLKEVLERHNAEIWSLKDEEQQRNTLRIMLPELITPTPEVPYVKKVSELPEEFYDFDLFHQPGQTEELDNKPLSELTYTVFDTETTGLNPSEGDEIISIGAVRIVNGRILKGEIFEQLVNPGRAISTSSVSVHGIQMSMLEGQPTIEEVLPVFHRYAENTILVAHNAAFDMRFFHIKEEETGVVFTNPILDTLLLSAVVHPNQERHSLEAIADRLGIPLIGRHTAVGDALVTAEVLLKLIPLLKEKGIVTLKEAREASQKTLYSRLKY